VPLEGDGPDRNDKTKSGIQISGRQTTGTRERKETKEERIEEKAGRGRETRKVKRKR